MGLSYRVQDLGLWDVVCSVVRLTVSTGPVFIFEEYL